MALGEDTRWRRYYLTDGKLALGICGSPRHGGNTISLIREALKAAQGRGMETEEVFLVDLKIGPCLACMGCKEGGARCVLDDDLESLVQKARRADVIVVGSPVYMEDVTGQCKVLLDRMFSVLGPGPDWEFLMDFPHKRALVVATCEARKPGYPDQALRTMKYLLRHFGIRAPQITEMVEQGLPPAGVAIFERPGALRKAFGIGATLADECADPNDLERGPSYLD